MVAEAVKEAVGVGRNAGGGLGDQRAEAWKTALSSGTLVNRSRSTSVWKVEIVLDQVAPDSTVTVWLAPAICRTSLTVVPTEERISTFWLNGAKPLAETSIV